MMHALKLFVLAVMLGIWARSAAEPLISVNNLNPLTWDLKYNIQIVPLDANGKRVDALETQVLWTGQQQIIQVSIPAFTTPYTFTGVWIWYRIYSGTGVAPDPLQWGGFPHKQANKNIPSGIPLNCVYNAPTVMAGDLTCTPGPDTVPPSAPGVLNASAAGISAINLAWGVATDNVGIANYGVERCLGAGCTASYALIGTTVATSYSDSGLAQGQAYTYRVRASDAANNFGLYSNLASATTMVPAPPPPPPPVTACVRIPPVSPATGEVTDFTAKLVDGSGATWTIAPRVQPGDTVPGQVTLKRNGSTMFGGIEYAYRKGTGPVCVADFKSGPGVSCYSGSGWNFVAGAAGC